MTPSLKDNLAHLSEECHELGKVAIKMYRFGPGGKKKTWTENNLERLKAEYRDVRRLYKKVLKQAEKEIGPFE